MNGHRQNIVEALRCAVGHDLVLGPSEFGDRVFDDESCTEAAQPLAVVLPRSTYDVSATLKCCHQRCQPVVIQGGRTGLSGGATARDGEVVVSTERMNQVEKVDPEAGTLIVQAGVTLQAAQAAAADAGLMFPIDFGARGSCTIGGNLATNAGGNRVIRYGSIRDQVLGIEAVLADGRILDLMSPMINNSSGYDLKQLLIGSEGTLGVITKALLRLRAAPRTVSAAFVGLEDYDAVKRLLNLAQTHLPAGVSVFEVMWPNCYHRCMETLPGLRQPLSGGHTIYVLLEALDAPHDEFDALFKMLSDDGIAQDVAIARTHAEVDAFRMLLESPAEFIRRFPNARSYNINVEPSKLDALALGCTAGLEPLLRGGWVMVYGQACEGSLHVLAHSPTLTDKLADVADQIVSSVTRLLDGSMSTKHEIGMGRHDHLLPTRGKVELAVMRMIKSTLDPACLLGRGRIFAAGEIGQS